MLVHENPGSTPYSDHIPRAEPGERDEQRVESDERGERQESPKKKRGFWGRLFGGGDDDDNKKKKDDR